MLSSDKEVGLGALLYSVALLGWEVCAPSGSHRYLGNVAAGYVSQVPVLCGKISQVYMCCIRPVDRTCIVYQTQSSHYVSAYSLGLRVTITSDLLTLRGSL